MRDKALLGTKVKELSKKKNIPLYKLEEEVGIARGSISKWDEIDPSFEKVCAVAKILKVKVDNLIC